MRILTGTQTRQQLDTEQTYSAWRDAVGELNRRFAGSMSWKSVGGRTYLYRKSGGTWRSLGARNSETEKAYDQFHEGRDRLKARRDALDTQIAAMARINRAMGLGRLPWTAARILRRLDREGLLGRGLRVVGTNALYAYERMGGVHFGSDVTATMDIDFLFDARGRLNLAGPALPAGGLVGLLRGLDASFAPVADGSFRAANDQGFLVDLITPATRTAATTPTRGDARAGDLTPVEIVGLGWLESSPACQQTIIDERGYPLTITVADPRAFAMHKLWLSRRDDRDPAKRRRDAAQAVAVATLLATHLPHLRFDDPVLSALPKELHQFGAALARQAAAKLHAPREDWD